MHWAEGYIGRAYVPKVYDCASLAADVQREVFNRAVPDYSERAELRSQNQEMLMVTVKESATRTEHPEEGCLAQIAITGHIQHIGVYCVVNGEPCLLHNIKKFGTILTRVRDLPRHGWKVEGYYTWN